MKAAVILSGCGVYDGSEIHEATFTLLALAQAGASYQCFAPDREQHHVVNHTNGEEMKESRNILIESARIARGEVKALDGLKSEDFDVLIIPGGFGAAKNLNQWALSGPEGQIYPEVKGVILSFLKAAKPICGLCMGPTVLAKALEESNYAATLSVGSTKESSPYDIAGIHQGMASLGQNTREASISEVICDDELKVVSAPCYMLEAGIDEVYLNIKQAIDKTLALV